MHRDDQTFERWLERIRGDAAGPTPGVVRASSLARPRVPAEPKSGAEDVLKGDLRELAQVAQRIQLREMRTLSDDELDQEIKGLLTSSDDPVAQPSIPRTFAVAAEVCRRAMGWEQYYRYQLETGLALLAGRFVELPNGEGKTAAAVPPFFYRALRGGKCHLFTANPFLARRDAGNYGRVYHRLGLSVGVAASWGYYVFDLTEDSLPTLRPHWEPRDVYGCDVVYCDCTTPITDYLRNEHQKRPERYLNLGLDFAVLDEVDFVLLDKGRRPVVLSRYDDRYESDISALLPLLGDDFLFREDEHFEEVAGRVRLLEEGLGLLENALGRGNLYDPDRNRGVIPLVHRMLHARTSCKRGEEYIVAGQEIVPLDALTYRPGGGQFCTDGTLQMLEYREGLRSAEYANAREGESTASIMPHSYFGLFRRLAGMSGTVKIEESRFAYFLPNEVYVIHRPRTRDRTICEVHATLGESLEAAVEEVLAAGERPVLVIAPTIALSNRVHDAIQTRLPAERVLKLLNAENFEEEERITLSAGQPGSVLVTTPMLGRGADIPLTQDTRELGGLLVISLGRHLLRRLDQQVEGRCGRRGDPGQCIFHVSLEDELFGLLMGDGAQRRLSQMMGGAGVSVESRMVASAITNAQLKMENHQFELTKHEFDLDRSIHHQRDEFYRLRRTILMGDGKSYRECFRQMLENLLNRHPWLHPGGISSGKALSPKCRAQLDAALRRTGVWLDSDRLRTGHFTDGQRLYDFLTQELAHALDERLADDAFVDYFRFDMLSAMDEIWVSHLARMNQLRNRIFIGHLPSNAAMAQFQREAERLKSILLVEIEMALLRLVDRRGVETGSDGMME